jgi:hypothetical protein
MAEDVWGSNSPFARRSGEAWTEQDDRAMLKLLTRQTCLFLFGSKTTNDGKDVRHNPAKPQSLRIFLYARSCPPARTSAAVLTVSPHALSCAGRTAGG